MCSYVTPIARRRRHPFLRTDLHDTTRHDVSTSRSRSCHLPHRRPNPLPPMLPSLCLYSVIVICQYKTKCAVRTVRLTASLSVSRDSSVPDEQAYTLLPHTRAYHNDNSDHRVRGQTSLGFSASATLRTANESK